MAVLTARQKFIQVALKYSLLFFGLPKTGQTSSYESWDDGYYQIGKPKTGPRFTDNGDGTITDNATGLMWLKDPSQLGGWWGDPPIGKPYEHDWEDSLTHCATLNYAGYEDWRMPNINEILSLVDYDRENPSLPSLYFPNTKVYWYWSSTTWYSSTTFAWAVEFGYGNTTMGWKENLYFIRPVRGGI